MNICGGSHSDYIIEPRNIVNDIKQFKSTIELLRETYNKDKSFFYFYLINTLNDYNIIHVDDIFTVDDQHIIHHYILKIIQYYESYINKNEESHRRRIITEFDANADLKRAMTAILLKMNVKHDKTNLEKIKKSLTEEILNCYNIKKGAGFVKTKFNIIFNTDEQNNILDTNRFEYVNNLLDNIIKVNEYYYDYFEQYSIDLQKNIKELYNIANQI